MPLNIEKIYTNDYVLKKYPPSPGLRAQGQKLYIYFQKDFQFFHLFLQAHGVCVCVYVSFILPWVF